MSKRLLLEKEEDLTLQDLLSCISEIPKDALIYTGDVDDKHQIVYYEERNVLYIVS